MQHRWRMAVVVVSLLAAATVACAATLQPHHRASVRASADKAHWPRPHVLDAATRAFRCARASGELDGSTLTVIDYSLPSTEPRLWVIDLDRRKVLFHELVAHGRNSGWDRPTDFSDVPGSKKSSLGLYRTAETYVGKHGFSLRLDGLEPGFNDTARDRAIVLHGADYVSPRSIAKLGRLGRSWGCPAVRREVSRPLINRIRNGTALFVYYPDQEWLKASRFAQCRISDLAGR